MNAAGVGAEPGAGAAEVIPPVIAPAAAPAEKAAPVAEAAKAPAEAGAAAAGKAAEVTPPADPRDALISKWQGEAEGNGHRADSAEGRLRAYKEAFGELPPKGERAAPRPAEGAGKVAQPGDDVPDALKEGWAPKDMAEFQQGLRDIAQYGAKLAHQGIGEQQAAVAEAEKAVNDFVNEVKTVDKEFDENVFFGYAEKYKFPLNSVQDLHAVYHAFVDFNRGVRDAEARGAKGKEDRKTPVGKPGAGSGDGTHVPFTKISQARSITDLVHDSLHK